MASSKEYLDFILEQLSELDDITHRGMMGEFIIYYKGKIVGGIYDDRFLVKPTKSALDKMPDAEMELPYEGAKEMLRHAFEDLDMQRVWIGYYEGNKRSKRVQEKCGFKYQWKSENLDVPLMHEKRTGHVSLMTKDDFYAISTNGSCSYFFICDIVES